MESIAGDAPREGRSFEDLLSANLDALYRMSVHLCGNRDDADDLLQEATLRAFERRRQLRDPGAVRSWLFRILARTHQNRTRSDRRRPDRTESHLADGQFEAALAAWSRDRWGDDWLERLADRECVHLALRSIDPRFRTVLLLFDVEEFSQREIAEMLDVPEGTVASRLYRGRRALRDILEQDAKEAISRRAI